MATASKFAYGEKGALVKKFCRTRAAKEMTAAEAAEHLNKTEELTGSDQISEAMVHNKRSEIKAEREQAAATRKRKAKKAEKTAPAVSANGNGHHKNGHFTIEELFAAQTAVETFDGNLGRLSAAATQARKKPVAKALKTVKKLMPAA